jgi:hypothetical protein
VWEMESKGGRALGAACHSCHGEPPVEVGERLIRDYQEELDRESEAKRLHQAQKFATGTALRRG